MLKLLSIWFSDRFLSRWAVLALDMIIVIGAYLLSTLLRYNFDWKVFGQQSVTPTGFLLCITYLTSFLFVKSYVGVLRHSGFYDALKLLTASVFAMIGAFLFAVGNDVVTIFPQRFSFSIIVIHFFLVVFSLVTLRFVAKSLFRKIANVNKDFRTRVLIYGAGDLGIITKNTLQQHTAKHYDILGFIDDNPRLQSKTIDGLPVYSPEILEKDKISNLRAHQLILSIQKLDQNKKREIVDKAIELGLKVKVVPAVGSWINRNLTVRQIKSVRIEDLLEREVIRLDKLNLSENLKGKRVLVTGAAGSIGSELVRQVLHYKPAQVIMVDQAESPLHELNLELEYKLEQINTVCISKIADITDQTRMRLLFESYAPELVFHAAAYKHVPLMEANVAEAVNVNSLGTKLLADLSIEFGVEKFVMVSTDKAVNPTNVMGASKRLAEMYVQSLSFHNESKTNFITTRFGNVLGSNGSVIPLFRKQIESGGPITVTHPDITRYFMTISEACSLVLEAGAMGNGGEIFVFDMGESVKIVDLARKMIVLSGLEPDRDIKIQFSGLRPGEKLYEELLAIEENNKPTYHPKIMIAEVCPLPFEQVRDMMEVLRTVIKQGSDFQVVRKMKDFVPEYVSNNSVFSQLDDEEVTKVVN